MRNLPLTFDFSTYSQKLEEDFAKFCGLLRIYELYIDTKTCKELAFETLSSEQSSKVGLMLELCISMLDSE